MGQQGKRCLLLYVGDHHGGEGTGGEYEPVGNRGVYHQRRYEAGVPAFAP